ncbi:MAG: class I SAM-dependent methyltransferase, partial [Verrucomicrobiota bacterium]
MIAECPVCRETSFRKIWTLPQSPLLQLVESSKPLPSDYFAPLQIVRCVGCAHLFNKSYEPHLWSRMYTGPVLSNKPVHPSMITRLADVLTWIGMEHIQGKHVIEVGAGTGHLARILASAAKTVQVFEPSVGLTKTAVPERNIELFNEPFSSSRITRQADLIICRQVLEHLAQPFQLLREIGQSLTSSGHLYLEVPAAEFIEAQAAFYELHNAHVQYFHRHNLVALGTQAGLVPLKEQDIMDCHDRGILFALANGVAFPPPTPTPTSNSDFDTLVQRLQAKAATLQTQWARQPGRHYLYGATWHAVAFLGAINDSIPIEAVLDDNTDYHGYHLYTRKHVIPVSSINALKPNENSSIMITAHLHQQVIRSRLR